VSMRLKRANVFPSQIGKHRKPVVGTGK
jgi:hypothetical protein